MTSPISTLLQISIETAALITALCVVVSTLTEIVASFFNFRSVVLRYSLKRRIGKPLYYAFYSHPIISRLSEFKFHIFSPYEIKKDTFQDVLMDVMDGSVSGKNDATIKTQIGAYISNLVDPITKSILASFLDHSATTSDFRNRLGDWFDEINIRTTAIYSRNMKAVGFVITMVIALVFKIDTFSSIKQEFMEETYVALDKKSSSYVNGAIQHSLYVFMQDLVTENPLVYKGNEEKVAKKIDSLSQVFTAMPIASCSPHVDTLMQKEVQRISLNISRLKVKMVSSSNSEYPKTVLTGIENIAKKYPQELEVSCSEAKAAQDEYEEASSMWPFLKTSLYWFIHLILLGLFVSLGSETWFKFLDGFIKVRTKINK